MSPARGSDTRSSAPHVAVVILNWNGWRETTAAICSVFHQDYRNCTLIVLDNGSTDGSAERLVDWLRERDAAAPLHGAPIGVGTACTVLAQGARTIMLRNGTNAGFAGGNNIAIGHALDALDPAYIFLLNSDATMDPGCLRRCVELARARAAAIVGAVVKGTDRTTLLFAGADPVREMFMFSGVAPETDLPEVWETGRAEGSGQLLEAGFLRLLFAQRGHFLDPGLFMYCEDLDLALNARRLGRKVLMTKSAVIYHGVAQASGGSGNPLQFYYITRNRIFLAQRWLSPPQKLFFHACYAPLRIARMVQRFLQGKREVSVAIWEGVRDGYLGRAGRWTRHTDRRP